MAKANKKSSKAKWYQNFSKPAAGALVFAVVFGLGGAYYMATSHALTPVVNITAGQMTPDASPTPPVKLPYLTQELLPDKYGKIVYDLPASYVANQFATSSVWYTFRGVNPTAKTTYRVCAGFRRNLPAPADSVQINMITTYTNGGGPTGIASDLSSVSNLSVAGTDKYIYSCAPQKDFWPRTGTAGYDIRVLVGNLNAKSDLRVSNIVLERN